MLDWQRETANPVRIVCRDADAGLLCVRRSKCLVYPRVRRCVRPGFGVRIPPRSLAVRTGGSGVVRRGRAEMVAGAARITFVHIGFIHRFAGKWGGETSPQLRAGSHPDKLRDFVMMPGEEVQSPEKPTPTGIGAV
jgi:hypothetical protein